MRAAAARRRRYVAALYDRIGLSAYRFVLAMTHDHARTEATLGRVLRSTRSRRSGVTRADDVALLHAAWVEMGAHESLATDRAACVLAGPLGLDRSEVARVLDVEVGLATALIRDGLRSMGRDLSA